MNNSSIVIDLDNPKTSLVAEALSNKTCIKILSLLADTELTATDVSGRLDIPLNTAGYNLDKLIASGLVEKSSNFFWSVKGKKTPVYKVANKRIIISPKRQIRSVVPVAIISGIFALVLKTLSVGSPSYTARKIASDAGASALVAESVTLGSTGLLSVGWIWFLAGSLFSLIVALLWDLASSRRSLR